MTKQEAINLKFDRCPKDFEQAKQLMSSAPCNRCLICGSVLLVVLSRNPINTWIIHCNQCESEVPIFVVLNRKSWRKLAVKKF